MGTQPGKRGKLNYSPYSITMQLEQKSGGFVSVEIQRH